MCRFLMVAIKWLFGYELINFDTAWINFHFIATIFNGFLIYDICYILSKRYMGNKKNLNKFLNKYAHKLMLAIIYSLNRDILTTFTKSDDITVIILKYLQ